MRSSASPAEDVAITIAGWDRALPCRPGLYEEPLSAGCPPPGRREYCMGHVTPGRRGVSRKRGAALAAAIAALAAVAGAGPAPAQTGAVDLRTRVEQRIDGAARGDFAGE